MVAGRPPRIRSACTACHAAKVRCTGEKTGCRRCRQSDMTCTYQVSLVGRMSKRRRQKGADRAHNTDGETAAEYLEPLSRSVSCGDQGCLNPCKLVISSPGSYDSSAQQLCDQPQQEYPDVELRSSSGFVPFNTEIESILPCLRQADMLPLSPDSTWLSPSTSGSPAKEKWSPEPQATSLISELTAMLESLEAHTQSNSRRLDEVLQMNRVCMNNLGRILTTVEYPSYRSIGMLMSSALDLIIYSFEKGVKSQGWGSQCISGSCGTLSSVQFGVFEVDPEEQAGIAKRIVLKEIKMCLEIVRGLEGGCRCQGPEGCTTLVVQSCSMLEQRANSLVLDLER